MAEARAQTGMEQAGGGGGLPKTYRPADHEGRVTSRWETANAFHVTPGVEPSTPWPGPGSREPYCIVIPPPNVTDRLHLGHALNNTLPDVLIRAHRMMGYLTLWMPGTDHAGIATQAVVERRLRKEGKLKGPLKESMKREDFVAIVQAFKDAYEATITGQLKAMGCSCDWPRQRFTMDDQCAAAVREAFFRLFKDGLIYRGKRLVNWDPALQTAVADDECYDEEVDTSFWYLKYPLQSPSRLPDGTTIDSVTVATTRPETYLGDTAIGMNPKDPRAAALVGKKVILPLVGRVIPIVADDYVVLPKSMARTEEEANDPKAEFATGFLKVTPAHDQNDYDLYQRHKAAIDANSAGTGLINVMAPDASISDKHGWADIGGAGEFVGMPREKARKAVVERFKAEGLFADVKPYRQGLKFSDRSKAVIEPYLSDQWYVRVTDDCMAGAANRALVAEQRKNSEGAERAEGSRGKSEVGDGALKFYPARYSKTYESWHDNIRDWCISRQLWWGHRIPVWTAKSSVSFPESGDTFEADLRRWNMEGRIDEQVSLPSYAMPGLAEQGAVLPTHYCVRRANDTEVIRALEAHGYQQDSDVLDTWFSSGLWPMSTMGWPEPAKFGGGGNEGMLETFNPTSVLCTAREIITLWVSRMVMFNRYFMGKGKGSGPVPYRDVFIHAMIQDGEGRKMSKSLGNGVDPLDIIATHGADAMRFTLVQMTTQTQDVRMPVSPDPATGKNTSPKFDNGRNFCNKLWNAARFTLGILSRDEGRGTRDEGKTGERALIDRWMLSRLAGSVKQVEAAIRGYEFNEYAQSLYDLLWRDFCDWYLEGIKGTVDNDPGQRAVLRASLDVILRLLHPIAPFITEAIHEHLRKVPAAAVAGLELPAHDLMCLSAWPRVGERLIDKDAEAKFENLRGLITAIREVRAQHDVPPRRKVTLHATDAVVRMCTGAGGAGLVEQLAGLEAIATGKAAADAVAFRFEGTELFLSNLADAVDAGTERARIAAQIAELEKSEGTLDKRLSNPGYAQKAPAKLVEESKAQLAKIRQELAALRNKNQSSK